jgi:hypothetical protein
MLADVDREPDGRADGRDFVMHSRIGVLHEGNFVTVRIGR